MVIYEKIYFEAYTNDQYIWHKNNIAQLYFILGRAELHLNFSSIPKYAPDIHRFSNIIPVPSACHAPVNRQTPVKVLPSRNYYCGR